LMLEPAFLNSIWSEENVWVPPQNEWGPVFDPSVMMAAAPMYSQDSLIYPGSYVPVLSAPFYDLNYEEQSAFPAPLQGSSNIDTPQLSVHAEDFIPISPSNWGAFQMALPLRDNTVPPAIEDQLNSQSLYKTELCRSFEETGTCRYGVKCQFAHGKDELRPVLRHPKYKTEICRTFHNSGSCPYGKRCRFIHLSADEGNLNSINIIPWTRMEENEILYGDNPEGEPNSEFDVDEIASKMRTLEVSDPKALKAKTKTASRKAKTQRRKNPNKKKSVSFEEQSTSPSSSSSPSSPSSPTVNGQSSHGLKIRDKKANKDV